MTWVLREPKFFTGGEDDADLIKLTYGQLFSRTGVELIKVGQRALELRYRLRFLRAGIKDWLPKERLDIYSVQVRLDNRKAPSRHYKDIIAPFLGVGVSRYTAFNAPSLLLCCSMRCLTFCLLAWVCGR